MAGTLDVGHCKDAGAAPVNGEFMKGDPCQERLENFSLALYFSRAWHTLSILIRTISMIFLRGLNIFAYQEVDQVVQGTEERSGL